MRGNKVNCVVSCPIDIYAGYGGRSRDLVKELIRTQPDWDISILPQRWGDCRPGYLSDHREFELMTRIVGSLQSKPDVWIQITVPNEFQPVGEFNIGITAAMETTLSPLEWLKGCNRMDLVITSSTHGKNSLVDSKWIINSTKETVEVQKPVEVLFEGFDTNTFKGLGRKFKTNILEGLKTSWNYLCVGHWLPGAFGEDRKNIGYTIKMFLETFKDIENAPGLILKTSKAVSSIIDREEILRNIRDIQRTVQYNRTLPEIYLLHGDLRDSEMNEIYNDSRVKAMVLFTKGEGFGRPLLEFSAVGKPIICSAWSGMVDFLKPELTAFVGGTLDKVHPSAANGMILQEASWFRPNDSDVKGALQGIYQHYDRWLEKAEEQAEILKNTKTMKDMGERLRDILNIYVPKFPERVELNLPGIEPFVKN